MRWELVCVLLLAAGLVGCSSGGSADPTSTTRKHATSTSTVVVDPSVIPDDPRDITVAYVDAVLKQLMKVYGKALEVSVSTGSVPLEAVDLWDLIYTPELAGRTSDHVSAELRTANPGIKVPPGDLQVTVDRIISASTHCVFVKSTVDHSEVAVDPGTPSTNYCGLVPNAVSRNPSPWRIAFDGFNEDGSQPEDPCAA
jgi:hypothetical protein